jgi:hypothetical protein
MLTQIDALRTMDLLSRVTSRPSAAGERISARGVHGAQQRRGWEDRSHAQRPRPPVAVQARWVGGREHGEDRTFRCASTVTRFTPEVPAGRHICSRNAHWKSFRNMPSNRIDAASVN